MSFSRKLVISTFAATGLATHFTSDTRISGTAAALGKVGELTTIDNGATCWLSGLGTHNIYGNLNINGNLVISQSDWTASTPSGQTSDWSGSADASNGVLINAGVILLNDVSAGSAPTYNWNLQTIQNSGTLHWCGRGDTGGSTFHLSASGDLVNNGLIVYEQINGNFGTAMTFANSHQVSSSAQASVNVYNNGGFLIRKARVDLTQQILGTGCWMIGDDAVLYLQDGLSLNNNFGYKSSLAGQSVSFTAGVSGTLHMDTAVYSHNSVFGATVYGFGAGHSLEFYESIKAVSYDSFKGVLTVKFYSSNHVDIKIGTGYDAAKFSIKAKLSFYASFNAVFYLGVAPSVSLPAQCSLTADACKPMSGPSGYSTGLPAYSTMATSVKPTTTLPGYPGASAPAPAPAYGGAGGIGGGFGLPSFSLPSISLPSVNVPKPDVPLPYGGPSVELPGYGLPTHSTPSVSTSVPLPGYGSPSLPAYGKPTLSLPAEGKPTLSLPAYGSPSLPAYGSPSLPAYGSPSLPAYGSPSLPAYGSPSLPAYGSPAYGSPASPTYGAPSVSTSGLPTYGAPSVSTPAVESKPTMLPTYGAPSVTTPALPTQYTSGAPVSSKAPISSPATSKAAGSSAQPPVYTSPSSSAASTALPSVYNSPSSKAPIFTSASSGPASSAPTSSCIASTTTVVSTASASTVTVVSTQSAVTVTSTASASTVTVTQPASTVTATQPASTVTATQPASTVTATAPASTVTITSYTSADATPTVYSSTTDSVAPTYYSTTSSADSSPTDSYDSYN